MNANNKLWTAIDRFEESERDMNAAEAAARTAALNLQARREEVARVIKALGKEDVNIVSGTKLYRLRPDDGAVPTLEVCEFKGLIRQSTEVTP